MGDANLESRDIFPAGWGLLGQWFCIKADATEEEQAQAVQRTKESLGSDFARCPDELIADRFYGGFRCQDDPTRVHVYFASGQYSFIAAGQGRYWPNDAASRRDMWGALFEHNPVETWQQIGPWTDDATTPVEQAGLSRQQTAQGG